jgi:CRISPR system Cascade subunit CasD
VIGLLAAALGRRRTDPIGDLAQLGFAVRLDQPGRLLRDFQTATPKVGKAMPLSQRFYIADAVFVAAVEGPQPLIDELGSALRRPAFPLYLGRRSCPPSRPLHLDTVDAPLLDALKTAPWQASPWYRRKQARTVELRVVRESDTIDGDRVRDQPITFNPELRQHGWRTVEDEFWTIDNPDGIAVHDAMVALVRRSLTCT